MNDPISGLFAKNSSMNLATSALPCAPVRQDERARRLVGRVTLRRLRRR
jgi:hypothetical protein